MIEPNGAEDLAGGRPDEGAPAKSIMFTGAWGIAIAFTVLLGVLGMASWTTNETNKASDLVAHTYDVLGDLRNVLSVLQDAETGQRGYLLTGNEAYLEPFVRANERIEDIVAKLHTDTVGNSRQQKSINRIEPLISDKLDELRQTIMLQQSGRHDAALEIVQSNQGKLIMDRIRVLIAEMESEETALLVTRQRDLKRVKTLSIFGGATGIILLIGIFAVVILRIGNILALRRRAEQNLMESEARTGAIVANVFDGLVTINQHGTMQTVNRAAERIFQYSAQEMVGQNVSMLTPEPHKSKHDAYLKHYLDTGQAKIIGIGREVEGQKRDGSIFPMELHVTEINIGTEVMFLGVTKDITERKEADRLKSEFVSTVSHELRTPLTSIKGSLGLVTSGNLGELPGQSARMIELAERNTERLISLVNDLLDMEKLQSGKMDFDIKKASLTDIVVGAVEINKPYADDKNVVLNLTEVEPNAFIDGDRERIFQVMSNLLSNAAKFSPEGGTVEISLGRDGANFRVSVTDHGEGIPFEFRAHLFDRFTQADSSDVRQQGGTGLGLNISRAIIENHGGVIDFESTPGKGATFFFDLAEFGKSRITAPATASTDKDATMNQAQILTGLNILVIEDDPDVAEFISLMLHQYGAVCDIAYDAREARAAIAATSYQALTLDMLLPDESGVSFLQSLRADEATKDIPVVVVSAIAGESRDNVLTSVMGVMDWLEKPIDEHRLIRAIKRGTELGTSGQGNILIVEDDADLTSVLVNLIGDLAEVRVAVDLSEARQQLALPGWSLVILDVTLPDGSGLDLIPFLKSEGRLPTPVIIYSAQEVSADIAAKVEHALVKSQTSNDDLLNMIKAMVVKPEGEAA